MKARNCQYAKRDLRYPNLPLGEPKHGYRNLFADTLKRAALSAAIGEPEGALRNPDD